MKTHERIQFYSESEMDEGIRNGRFFRIHRFAATPEGQRDEELFAQAQDKLILDLERRLREAYGNAAFVSDNLWPSEKLKVEIGSDEVSKQLMRLILQFLMDHRTTYCVGLSVYAGNLENSGTPYMGRILISGRGIAVEDSLKAFFEERLGATAARANGDT